MSLEFFGSNETSMVHETKEVRSDIILRLIIMIIDLHIGLTLDIDRKVLTRRSSLGQQFPKNLWQSRAFCVLKCQIWVFSSVILLVTYGLLVQYNSTFDLKSL